MKWRSVSDRKGMQDGERVLVHTKGGFSPVMIGWLCFDGRWKFDGDRATNEIPTHWLKLPEKE